MPREILRIIDSDQKGRTGLETAIILIGFVTLASVFAYAILSTGLYSAERGKETVYAGLAEARSNLEISGSVTAVTDNNATSVQQIYFSLKNAIAGNPIDITSCDGTSAARNKCIVSLMTKADYVNNAKWSRTVTGNDDGDNLLEPGEQVEIGINLSDLGDDKSLTDNLTVNDFFIIQVKPSLGSYITVQRTLPPALDKVMDLH